MSLQAAPTAESAGVSPALFTSTFRAFLQKKTFADNYEGQENLWGTHSNKKTHGDDAEHGRKARWSAHSLLCWLFAVL
jgi:hypothetical protein